MCFVWFFYIPAAALYSIRSDTSTLPLPLQSILMSYGAKPTTALRTRATSADVIVVSPAINVTGSGSSVITGLGCWSCMRMIGALTDHIGRVL